MKSFRRFRALFRKEELDQQLSEEMAFHLEKQIEQNLAAGMSAEEARYAALRRFGGVEFFPGLTLRNRRAGDVFEIRGFCKGRAADPKGGGPRNTCGDFRVSVPATAD
ncbi:MAG: permease prefix domain 1-containing protein [Terriglobia bacterium]|jgi:hypothetical protein